MSARTYTELVARYTAACQAARYVWNDYACRYPREISIHDQFTASIRDVLDAVRCDGTSVADAFRLGVAVGSEAALSNLPGMLYRLSAIWAALDDLS